MLIRNLLAFRPDILKREQDPEEADERLLIKGCAIGINWLFAPPDNLREMVSHST